MPKFAVILAAAGKSSRFSHAQGQANLKKPFVDLAGKPVWQHSLDAFLSRDDIVQQIVVVSPDDHAWFRQTYAALIASLKIDVVEGGTERSDSVANAVAAISESAEFVAIHDAARPCIDPTLIERIFSGAVLHGNCIPAVAVASTIKRSADGKKVDETVDRSGLFLSQTPQAFSVPTLKDAIARQGELKPTDEAQLFETLGMEVFLTEGSPWNRKITTHEDLCFAHAALQAIHSEAPPIHADPSTSTTNRIV